VYVSQTAVGLSKAASWWSVGDAVNIKMISVDQENDRVGLSTKDGS
jgi:ribosomal protein S1